MSWDHGFVTFLHLFFKKYKPADSVGDLALAKRRCYASVEREHLHMIRQCKSLLNSEK
jgi:hypothetical protein